ncbi:MAG TPA: hypothetical protein VJM75_09195 [Acidimicrobiales bacterium]|nr:hypothetical protein [Acidimicrobiales bacterium]
MTDEDRDDVYCRICGCTDRAACPGGCSWVPDPAGEGDLCSACLERATAELGAEAVKAAP